jgi:YD repeat-containing protein
MRCAALIPLIVAFGPSLASAQDLPQRDPEADHPGVRSMTLVHHELEGKRLEKTHREIRTYDAAGHVTRIESRTPAGKSRGLSTYERDKHGRLTKRSHLWGSAKPIVRTFTYRIDGAGRILESIMRDPKARRGEHFRDSYRWNQDGSYSVQRYRHYDKEGPYKDDYKAYDAAGRLDRSCGASGFCEFIEYDAHGYVSRIRQQNRETHFYLVNVNRYDKQGRLVSRELGHGTTHFQWNARGDIAEERKERDGLVLSKVVYTYDYR